MPKDNIQAYQDPATSNNESAVRSAAQRTSGVKKMKGTHTEGLPPAFALFRSGGELKRGDSYDNR